MLETYGAGAAFSLAYRWGKSSPDPAVPEQTRAIETMSWKMFARHCLGGPDSARCEEQPRFTGYQRVRTLVCPEGHQFSTDAGSPYCVPYIAEVVRAEL